MADVVFTTKSFKFRDNEIELNQGETGNGASDGFAGFRIKRGTAPDALLHYNEATSTWQAGVEGSTLQDIITTTSLNVYEESDVITVVDPTTTEYSYVVVGSATTYDPNFVMVFINRLKLRKSEFTATNGTTVSISAALAVDDEIEVVTYK